MSADLELVGVAVLRDYPLRLWHWGQEIYDEILREFTLLLMGASDPDRQTSVPGRLLATAATFTTRYAPLLDENTRLNQEAFDRGELKRDVTVPLIAESRTIVLDLDALLDEVRAYCRSGDLLSLEAPALLVEFRKWWVKEIIGQIDGAEPTPWPGPFEAETSGEDQPA